VEDDWDVAEGLGNTRRDRDGGWAIGEGVFLLAIGALSLGIALLGWSLASVLLPFLLLLRAVDEFVSAFEAPPFGGSWHVILAGLSMLAAVLLLGKGTIGPISPLVFPGGYFLIDGAFRIVTAVKMRRCECWAWVLAVGIASVLLGLLGLSGVSPVAICAMLAVSSAASGSALFGRWLVFRREARQTAQVAYQR